MAEMNTNQDPSFGNQGIQESIPSCQLYPPQPNQGSFSMRDVEGSPIAMGAKEERDDIIIESNEPPQIQPQIKEPPKSIPQPMQMIVPPNRSSTHPLIPEPRKFEPSAPNQNNVPIQISKDFLNSVKKGNMNEILQSIEIYSLDVTKIVDDNFQHTCLYYAALIKDKESAYDIMKMFIEKGVSAAYTDILQQTALFYVAREGKLKCLDLLIENGCDPTHKDQYGQTALYYAAREGHIDIAKALLEKGTDVNSEDNTGQTAIFYSAREGYTQMCELLIDFEADVNKQDKKKQTPLHWAKKHNRQQVIDLLLEKGASPIKDMFTTRKETTKKIIGKKKQIDKSGPKKYVLTHLKDGLWIPVEGFELEDLLKNYPEVAHYLNNPDTVRTMDIPDVNPVSPIYDHWEKAAKRIINYLWKQSGAWIFHAPVDTEAYNIPDYYDLIKHPMDFGTIKQKLNSSLYSSCKEFVSDVDLVFSNCLNYNGDTSDYGIVAKNLREEFKRQYDLLSLEFYI